MECRDYKDFYFSDSTISDNKFLWFGNRYKWQWSLHCMSSNYVDLGPLDHALSHCECPVSVFHTFLDSLWQYCGLAYQAWNTRHWLPTSKLENVLNRDFGSSQIVEAVALSCCCWRALLCSSSVVLLDWHFQKLQFVHPKWDRQLHCRFRQPLLLLQLCFAAATQQCCRASQLISVPLT